MMMRIRENLLAPRSSGDALGGSNITAPTKTTGIASADQTSAPAGGTVTTGPELAARIEVTAPYYALDALRPTGSHGVSAEVTPEQPTYGECDKFSAAEVGRHLAILGSCALARNNPAAGKHFYLATSAQYRANLCALPTESPTFTAFAQPTLQDRRRGTAVAQLRGQSGIPLYDLVTNYQILTPALFRRALRSITEERSTPLAATSAVTQSSPYSVERDLGPSTIVDGHLVAKRPIVSAQECVGHFEEHPCLPVAIVMSDLARAADSLLTHTHGHTPYLVARANVRANRLIPAGTQIYLHAERVLTVPWRVSSPDALLFRCSARSATDELLADLEAEFAPIPATAN